MSPQLRNLLNLGAATLAGAALTAVFFLVAWRTHSQLTFTSPYQAVLLSNGAVYYGRLQGYGTPTPVLNNVFYIVTQTNPDTKQQSNILVKRGKELHGPDRMYLTPRHIIFVEPVGIGSKVQQLIAEAP